MTAKMRSRIRMAAKLFISMERGFYAWPDGKPHFDSNGMPSVNKAEILRNLGLKNESSSGRDIYALFATPEFEHDCLEERVRIDTGVADELSKVTDAVSSIAKGLRLELAMRLRYFPADIPTSDILKYAAIYTRASAEIEGTLHNVQNLTLVQVQGDLKERLPPGVYEQVTARFAPLLGDGENGKAG